MSLTPRCAIHGAYNVRREWGGCPYCEEREAMTHHDTSTDRDREAVEAVASDLAHEWGSPYPIEFREHAELAMKRLRSLGWSAPYDEPTEAMVEAAVAGSCVGEIGDKENFGVFTRRWMRSALVAAAKARGT